MNLKRVSFGGTAAIITNMALLAGLDSASVSKNSIIASILIVAIADNLTDSLSVHIYQEAENLEPKEAFAVTVSNFFARLIFSLSFVLQIYLLPLQVAIISSLIWGIFLLSTLTFLLARHRAVSVSVELLKHLSGALGIILIAKGIGRLILSSINV